jgi:hypothetical protein
MVGTEFIKMMKQDIETHKDKAILSNVVDIMEEIVKQNPLVYINSDGKTPENCYMLMREHAKKNAVDNSFCFTPKMSIEFIGNYLGLTATVSSSEIKSLESFLI